MNVDMLDIEKLGPMDSQYAEYLTMQKFVGCDPNDESVGCIMTATTWDNATAQFIELLNNVCPDHKDLHILQNLKETEICYAFDFGEFDCAICEEHFGIIPVPRN